MSGPRRIINVGASARASDLQAIANVAASADDRALSPLLVPGQPNYVSFSNQTLCLAPLRDSGARADIVIAGHDIDGTIPNGKVRLRGAEVISFDDLNHIDMSFALRLSGSDGDSPTFGNNAGASTRYDLLYLAMSYGQPTVQAVRQKPGSGTAPVTANLEVQRDMTCVQQIVPNVNPLNPTASLPASTPGAVYNIPLAVVALPAAYAGGPINQSMIAPLWNEARLHSRMANRIRLLDVVLSGAPQSPANSIAPERWGAVQLIGGYFKVVGAGPFALDDSGRGWARRLVWGSISYLGPATGPLPFETNPNGGSLPYAMATIPPQVLASTGTYNVRLFPNAAMGAGIEDWSYDGGTPAKKLTLLMPNGADTITAYSNAGPVTAGGDLFMLVLHVTDPIVAGF